MSVVETPEDAYRGAGLRLNVELSPPAVLPEGKGTAVFCAGWCYDPAEPIERLAIVVGGRVHPVTASRMPRPDVAAVMGEQNAYRSGFWAIVPIPGSTRVIDLELLCRYRDGSQRRATIGRIEPAGPDSPPGAAVDPETIVICLATYAPDPELLARQVESLRAQTDERWVCVVSDDCSPPGRFRRLEELTAGDARFTISRAPGRQGFYRNFERALSMVPPGAGFVGLCDQDDRWHPERLALLRAALGDALLSYSDQRVVERDGSILSDTLWLGRHNNFTNMASLLVANTVTGAATLFRRELLDVALPFPDHPGQQFHDHWLALAALATGEIAYVDEALYDYVQHSGAVFGDLILNSGGERAPRGPRAIARSCRAAYFHGYIARAMQARVLLERCPDTLTPRSRRALTRFAACERSPLAWAWLALRPLRALIGRNETLGSELDLAAGIAWRHLAGLLARFSTARRLSFSAEIPTAGVFSQRRLRRWRARFTAPSHRRSVGTLALGGRGGAEASPPDSPAH